jgi:hypothetical protein
MFAELFRTWEEQKRLVEPIMKHLWDSSPLPLWIAHLRSGGPAAPPVGSAPGATAPAAAAVPPPAATATAPPVAGGPGARKVLHAHDAVVRDPNMDKRPRLSAPPTTHFVDPALPDSHRLALACKPTTAPPALVDYDAW